MPQIVTLEDGTETEVFTQEEVDAIAQEKLAAETERIEAEKQEALEALAAEKAAAEEELQKLRNKEMNFEHVRKKAEGKEVEVSEDIKKQIETLNERINSLAEQPKQDIKQDFISQYLGGDKEQTERFEYYYSRLGAEAKTKEDVLKAAQEALTLASGGAYKPDASSGMYSTGVNHNYRNTPTDQVSEESKEIGKLFGITEEDRKKYGRKA